MLQMKVSAFASLIGTSPRTIYTLIKRGEVVTVHVGKKRFVDMDASRARLTTIGKLDEHGKYLPIRARVTEKEGEEPEGEGCFDFGEKEIATVSKVTPTKNKTSRPKAESDTTSPPSGTPRTLGGIPSDIPDDLAALLDNVYNPKDVTQVINNYWVGKKNRQAYEREKRDLIPLSEAKAVIDAVFIEVSEKMSNLPIDAKNRFPNMSEDMFKHLEWQINHIKQSMQDIPWES